MSDVTTFTSSRGSEQVPRDGVDHCNEEAGHDPLQRPYATQTFGKRPRQADSRPAGGLNGPQNAKYAEDHQAYQREGVVSEGC